MVLNGCNQEVMRGDRSKDNCYLWKSKDSLKGDQEGKLGHGRLDPLQGKGMKKNIPKGAMRRVSYLSVDKRDRQRCVLLSSAETQYLGCGSRWSSLVWRNLMQTEYNVTRNVMTLYATKCDNSKGKEGMRASEKL